MPTVTVNLSNMVVAFSPSGLTTLPYGGVLNLNIGTGFPPGAQFVQIPVYNVVSQNGVDRKGSLVGTWSSGTPSTQPATGITIATNPSNSTNVTFTDSDSTNSDISYWYGVSVQAGTQMWNGDPELLVKKLAIGGRAASA